MAGQHGESALCALRLRRKAHSPVHLFGMGRQLQPFIQQDEFRALHFESLRAISDDFPVVCRPPRWFVCDFVVISASFWFVCDFLGKVFCVFPGQSLELRKTLLHLVLFPAFPQVAIQENRNRTRFRQFLRANRNRASKTTAEMKPSAILIAFCARFDSSKAAFDNFLTERFDILPKKEES